MTDPTAHLVTDRLFDLRDYFAGQALCGLLSGRLVVGGAAGVPIAVQRAYEYADAMLTQRREHPVPETP